MLFLHMYISLCNYYTNSLEMLSNLSNPLKNVPDFVSLLLNSLLMCSNQGGISKRVLFSTLQKHLQAF